MYCLVIVTSLVLLVSGAPTTQAQQATSGVNLSLKGAYLANNSYVDVDDIGEDESALMCHTNKTDCCHNLHDRAGEWYFPNGSIVQSFVRTRYYSSLSDFFYRNRRESVVRLNRYGNNPLERGHFFCELPDANDVNKIFHVNILNISSLTISPSRHIEHGAGEMLSIYCRVDIVLPLNVPPPTFEWFFGPDNSSLPSGVTVLPVTNNGNTYNSTLQFSPLLVNHTGIYKCQLGGNRRLAANTSVTAGCNTVSGNKVHITGDENNVYVGDKYTLTCSFINSSRSHGHFAYQWRKYGSLIQNVTESTLNFSSVSLSDAGQYTCEVTVDSILYCETKDIILEIPAPSFVTITSDPVSPIRPVGSDVAVTCSVELSQAVDVPVNVSIHLTDPSGSQLSATSSALLSDSTYTSTATIRSFSRNHSGVYTCEATLNSDSTHLTDSGTLSKDVDITTHVYISLGNDSALENNTYLFVTDIGTSAPHQLVCTSDRMPCCRDPPQYGEWKFPNGSKVTHTNEGAVTFHSDRDNVGNVNLYRVSENVTSPGGQFCCEVEDATNTNTTLCVIIVPEITYEIVDSGNSPLAAGAIYNLTCSVSGASMTTYKWMKDGEILLETGPTLSFPSLRLSDTGRYTCEFRVYVWTYSDHHDISLKIPDPNVTLVSNKSNPIRPVGSAVALTCTVKLSQAVDVPVTLNSVWTGPDGFMTANTSSLTIVLGGSYTTLATIASFGRNQSGDYNCRVFITSASSMITDSNTMTAFTKVTVGVYLSMGGEILPSNRVICVTDIGTSELSHQYLVCTSDRKPCCRDPPQYGEWKFPNGSQVIHIYDHKEAVAFHRNRDNIGNVNLYRVSSDVTSPTGRFCCEITDATDTNHTLCVDIIPPVPVHVRDNGTTPIAGQSYTLICGTGSTVIAYLHNLSYRWIKDNGTQTEVGTGHSSISFHTLTLSDSGNYTCVVTVSSTSLKEDKEFRSTPYFFDVPVPEPVVGLVSITRNPILSGTSPTLTCTVELDPTVDVPVDITTVWSGPDGSTLTSDASPVMKSFTHYTSKLSLNYVELSDSGNYTCTVSIRGKIRASVSKEVVINDGVFQLRLIDSDICQPWFKKENYQSDKRMKLYKSAIEGALIEAIESHCECRFPKDHLLNAIFKCASSPNLTTYRNTLIGTHNFNATQLIGFLQDWVNSAPYIDVNDYAVSVDKSCPVSIASLSDPECGEVSQCPCANDPNVAKCVEHLENEDFTACINSCI